MKWPSAATFLSSSNTPGRSRPNSFQEIGESRQHIPTRVKAHPVRPLVWHLLSNLRCFEEIENVLFLEDTRAGVVVRPVNIGNEITQDQVGPCGVEQEDLQETVGREIQREQLLQVFRRRCALGEVARCKYPRHEVGRSVIRGFRQQPLGDHAAFQFHRAHAFLPRFQKLDRFGGHPLSLGERDRV